MDEHIQKHERHSLRHSLRHSYLVILVFLPLSHVESHAVRTAPGFIPCLSSFLSHLFTIYIPFINIQCIFNLLPFLPLDYVFPYFPGMLIVISVCDLLRMYFFLIPYSFFHVFPLRSPYRNYSPCLLPIFISVPDLPLIPHSFSIYALAVPNLFTISPVSSSFMSHVFPRLSQFIPHFFPLPFTPPVICDFIPHFRSLDVFAIYSIRF